MSGARPARSCLTCAPAETRAATETRAVSPVIPPPSWGGSRLRPVAGHSESASALRQHDSYMSTAAGPLAEPLETEPQDAVPEQSPAPRLAQEGPTPEEIKLPVLENVDRAITGVITALSPL